MLWMPGGMDDVLQNQLELNHVVHVEHCITSSVMLTFGYGQLHIANNR